MSKGLRLYAIEGLGLDVSVGTLALMSKGLRLEAELGRLLPCVSRNLSPDV